MKPVEIPLLLHTFGSVFEPCHGFLGRGSQPYGGSTGSGATSLRTIRIVVLSAAVPTGFSQIFQDLTWGYIWAILFLLSSNILICDNQSYIIEKHAAATETLLPEHKVSSKSSLTVTERLSIIFIGVILHSICA